MSITPEMSLQVQIQHSEAVDLPLILSLFGSAIAYQESKGYEVWPRFSEEMILSEIEEKRHWKIIDHGQVACIFSVLYADPLIWGDERDKEPSVYLHRIAVNPVFKGRNMMELVRDWALDHARSAGRRFVRMDTWGHNENLRNYYIRCGFRYIGQQEMPIVDGLPLHYGGSVLSLFQIEA
jgi:GNAT superfamily N-acetyltransferase